MNKQEVLDFFQIDVAKLKESITEATKLEDNNEMFLQLSNTSKAKQVIKDVLDELESVESEAKSLINNKAKTLYGVDWQAIVGEGYKINRQPTGNVYIRNPEIPVNKKFIEIKESINTKVVDAYIEKEGKLPNGIEINPTRGESIRISIK